MITESRDKRLLRGGTAAIASLRAGLAAAACALLLALPAPHPAQAREGLYVGLGASSQSLSDAIKGTETLSAAPIATNEVRLGKLESASGFVFNGGFGFNDYVALDMLLTYSRHDSAHEPGTAAAQDFNASLRTVLLSAKVGAPLGDVAELFGHAGIGGYELVYGSNNFDGGLPVDDSRVSGSGFAAGVGGELFFGPWGLQLAYTVHDAEFSSVDSLGFQGGSLNPTYSPTIQSVALLLNYYLE